jgi:hypothetical protein
MAIQPRREPVTEPWRATARRTGTIALAIGVGVGLYERQLAAVPSATLLAMWFTLGGHLVEVIFRDHLRYRMGGQVPVQVVSRLVYWFAGGSALYAGALTTRAILTGRGGAPWPWWTGGVAFVGLELLVHLMLHARRCPSFYDGRG